MEPERTLAEKLDKTIYDYDPYNYRDCDGSVDQAEEWLRDPYDVIDKLLDIINELME